MGMTNSHAESLFCHSLLIKEYVFTWENYIDDIDGFNTPLTAEEAFKALEKIPEHINILVSVKKTLPTLTLLF